MKLILKAILLCLRSKLFGKSRMDEDEARAILDREIKPFEEKSYRDLVAQMKRGQVVYTVPGPSGTLYKLEFELSWEDRQKGLIEVLGFIYDSGWRRTFPITQRFVKNSSGEVV